MIVKVIGGKISDEEKEAYVKYVKDKNPKDEIDSLTIEVDGDFVNLTYHKQPIPFSRIRLSMRAQIMKSLVRCAFLPAAIFAENSSIDA